MDIEDSEDDRSMYVQILISTTMVETELGGNGLMIIIFFIMMRYTTTLDMEFLLLEFIQICILEYTKVLIMFDEIFIIPSLDPGMIQE